MIKTIARNAYGFRNPESQRRVPGAAPPDASADDSRLVNTRIEMAPACPAGLNSRFDVICHPHEDVQVQIDDLKAQAQALRAAGNTPKQIARALGVPRAKITSLVRGIPASRPNRPPSTPTPLIGCWITRQWSNGLTIQDRPADWIDDDDLPPLAPGAGLPSIAVVRAHDDTDVSICGYLVDTYCLGVKNALPPNMINRRQLSDFLADFFAAYAAGALPAPLELAQDLVFGAVDYARGLGFDPHRDFSLAAGHLDAWQPPSRITFGRDGKPHFQQGPYDNPTRILRTLDGTVGPGNYHFTTIANHGP